MGPPVIPGTQPDANGWSRAYKLKPAVKLPQPLAKKDVWIVKRILRCDSAAPVFWGSHAECKAEEYRLEMSGEMKPDEPNTTPTTKCRKRNTLDHDWELLNGDAEHPYQWRRCAGSSHTRTYSFTMSEPMICVEDTHCDNELERALLIHLSDSPAATVRSQRHST